MSKVLFTCCYCGVALQSEPEMKSAINPHPHQICSNCEAILDSSMKYRSEMVPDSYYWGAHKHPLRPNYLK